ncbi:hypothetical protein NBH20_24135 [Rhizobium sp. S153]|uniref:Uncharacterized protein n=2 Tax=Ciceribacter sichuanensis TaxID=2949647 RepID=A0ABT0VEE0_9HYPH|nr:hypothetical protein [Ciceribacter sp. S153]MCM2404271.1 hypothetical protein [Ciceribacter sp. S153]
MAATTGSCCFIQGGRNKFAAYAKDILPFERKGLVFAMKRNSLRARNGQRGMNEDSFGSGVCFDFRSSQSFAGRAIPVRNSVNLTFTNGKEAVAQYARGRRSLGPVQPEPEALPFISTTEEFR